MKVGVLALQGDFPEHREALERVLPARAISLVRSVKELQKVDALVLPGGESTTISDLLTETGLWPVLQERIADGLPVLATCAGLILLAKQLEAAPSGRSPRTFGVLDVLVRRNDYGSQRESFEAPVRITGVAGGPFPGVFIRAPRILKIGKQARPVALQEREVVGVRTGSVVGLSFHPELAEDSRLHAWFLKETLHYTPPKASQ
jgi:5'-phosphate synthase pdxT subunit